MIMPDISQLILFLTATLLVNLTPGNDVMYVLSQSIHGYTRGLLAVLGISTGIALYIIAISLSLIGIFQHYPILFTLIKTGGALYLLYLAWKTVSGKRLKLDTLQESALSTTHAYYNGIYTTLLNPKVAIFLLTFLPQFANARHGSLTYQLLFLGACFTLSSTIVNGAYSVLFCRLKTALFTYPHAQKWLNILTGMVFVGIAVKVLLD